jgi:hypothetical protein
MSTDRETTRIVRSWLEDGVTRLPDSVLDAVLDELPTTHQRRATWWPARRTPHMNYALRVALASAAVVVVALIGFTILREPNMGDPDLVGPTPTPMPLADGLLAAGTYVSTPFEAPNDSISFTFTVPDGWRGADGDLFLATGTESPDGAAILFTMATGLFSDPCDADYFGGPDVVVGPTVDDLARAFEEQTAYEATTPVDVTVDGYSGKRVDLQLPSDDNPDELFNQGGRFGAACRDGGYFLWDGSIYAQGPDNRWHLWIVDVDGTRVVIQAEDFPGTSAQDQAELQDIVESIRIDP